MKLVDGNLSLSQKRETDKNMFQKSILMVSKIEQSN